MSLYRVLCRGSLPAYLGLLTAAIFRLTASIEKLQLADYQPCIRMSNDEPVMQTTTNTQVAQKQQ
jgi:hypothetical protein